MVGSFRSSKVKLSCPSARHEGEWRRGSEDVTPLILHLGRRCSSVASLGLRSVGRFTPGERTLGIYGIRGLLGTRAGLAALMVGE